MAAMFSTKLLTAIREREGDGYVALCPEVDIASQGATVEEARANLKEALERLRGLDPLANHYLFGGEGLGVGRAVSRAARELGDLGDEPAVPPRHA